MAILKLADAALEWFYGGPKQEIIAGRTVSVISASLSPSGI